VVRYRVVVLVMKWYGCWVCGGSALVKYYLVVGMTVDGWCEWVGGWVTSDVVVSRVVVGLLVKIMNSSYGFFKEENRFEGMFGWE
jgi:hypothetical protein